MYPKGRIESDIETTASEPDPIYYGTARFNGMAIELWRARWRMPTSRKIRVRWYARFDGQSESEFHGTRSEWPADAIGHAILGSDENSELSDRLYS